MMSTRRGSSSAGFFSDRFNARGTRRRERAPADQLGLFAAPDPRLARLADELRAVSLDGLTPLEALNLLAELKRRLE